jgi:hypothetical protein
MTTSAPCPGCGKSGVYCICHPSGGFFATYEEKRQYYLKHPETEEKSGRKYVVSVPKLDKRDE